MVEWGYTFLDCINCSRNISGLHHWEQVYSNNFFLIHFVCILKIEKISNVTQSSKCPIHKKKKNVSWENYQAKNLLSSNRYIFVKVKITQRTFYDHFFFTRKVYVHKVEKVCQPTDENHKIILFITFYTINNEKKNEKKIKPQTDFWACGNRDICSRASFPRAPLYNIFIN